MGILITNYAFKSRVFYWFNHLYTPCRTRNTTFYKLIVKAMQMLPDGRRVFAVKLTNSLAIILLRNTRRIVGIFITNCAFKSRVFCWFNHLNTPCRTGDLTFYKHVVKTMQMLLDGRRVFTEKLTNSLAIALLRNTRRIVGIFITNCAFKSSVLLV